MVIKNTGESQRSYPDPPGLMRGLISDVAHRALRIDPSTHVQGAIEYEHFEIHEGRSFLFQEGFELNNASRTYLIEAADSNRECHMVITVMGSQDGSVEFVERTDHHGGDEVVIHNRNKRSSNTPETRVWRNPDGSDGGQSQRVWGAQFGVAAAGGGRGAAGGDTSSRHEIILARRATPGNIGKYSLRCTALSANAQNWTVSIDFYEHMPRN